jgi:hypothetical protein
LQVRIMILLLAIVASMTRAQVPASNNGTAVPRPNRDLFAIGASQLAGAPNEYPGESTVTASSLEPLGKSLVVAARGPGLWYIDLNKGKTRRIELPEALNSNEISITSVGWDGARLILICSDTNEHARAWVGTASAPDFGVTLVSAPDPRIVAVTLGKPKYGSERFKIEEGSACDEDEASPHCGQSGLLRAFDTETGRKTIILQAPVSQLSYLTDPAFGGIIVFGEDEPSTDPNARWMGSGARFTTGLTLLNLAADTRAHFELPGPGTRDITLLAEQTVRVANETAMRVAYTVEGDCDPKSTENAQPNKPTGSRMVTPNNWSLCVVTVPLPAIAKSQPVRHPTPSSKKFR